MKKLILMAVAAAGLVGVAGPASAQNPVVFGTGSVNHHYDPFSDVHYIDRTTLRLRQSYFDADRGLVDPGSLQFVDRVVRDQYGRLVREHGVTWTSNGVPHGDLTRERITVRPGCQPWGPTVVHHDKDQVLYSQKPSTVIEHDKQIVGYSMGGGPSVVEKQKSKVLYMKKP